MPHSRTKLREILLLLVPCLLVLGVGVWVTYRQRAIQKEQAGPIRAVITKTEVLPVTPLESWQGFDWKVTIHVQTMGGGGVLSNLDPSPKIGFGGVHCFPQLVWKQGKQERVFNNMEPHQFKFRPSKTPLQYVENGTPPTFREATYSVLCSDQQLPKGGEIYLRGEALIEGNVKPLVPLLNPPPEIMPPVAGSTLPFLRSRRAKFNIPLRVSGDDESLVVDKATPKTGVLLFYRRTNPTDSFGMEQHDTEITFEVDRPASTPEDPERKWRFDRACLVDTNGKVIPGFEELPADALETGVTLSTRRVTKHLIGRVAFRQADWKLPSGIVNLRTFISCNESWPAEVVLPVRKRDDWRSQTCKDLKLLDIRQMDNNVIVRFQYLGDLPPSTERGGRWFDTSPYASTTNDLVTKANRSEIITSWSQQIRLNGSDSSDFHAKLLFVDQEEDIFSATYQWQWPFAGWKSQPGIFTADIGIRGQGFMKVSTPVVVTAKNPVGGSRLRLRKS